MVNDLRFTFQQMNKTTLLGEGEPEPVQVLQASADLFPLLAVMAAAGLVMLVWIATLGPTAKAANVPAASVLRE